MAELTDFENNGEVAVQSKMDSDNQINSTQDEDCRMCRLAYTSRVMIRGDYCFAAWDSHPASPGHFLVVPHRHFADYFDISDAERNELWALVSQGKIMADEKHQPDGYNIGINVGQAAGQSIFHLHVHVIPRYKGDVENPKGGVRGVIPKKKLYNIKPD